MLYRIYIESSQQTEQIVSGCFDAFTILDGTGYWKGEREPCQIVEIVAEPEAFPQVHRLANSIKLANEQDAVLVEQIPNHQEYV